MKKLSRIILIVYTVILILMLIFPIIHRESYDRGGIYKYDCKYVFVGNLLYQYEKQGENYKIHTGLYLIQILLVTLIFVSAYYLVRTWNKE